MTFCEPNDYEREDLLETGNFGGQFGWFSGQAKNVPPKVKAEQNVADEITPIDSFESPPRLETRHFLLLRVEVTELLLPRLEQFE